MPKEHYLQVKFSLLGDNSPEIYNFLFLYVGDVLKKLGIKTIDLHIHRLEPLDEIYTNIYNVSRGKLRRIFAKFAKSHHLLRAPDLAATHERASLRARVHTASLQEIFRDYNVLFDIFFTDLLIKSGRLSLDVMDPFSNSMIAISKDKGLLEKFKRALKKKTKKPVKFAYIDSKPRRIRLTHIRRKGAKY